MSASHAVARLWVFGTVFWIGFWGWQDFRKCIAAPGRVLFCPSAGGDALLRTDYLHALSFVLGPPLASLLAGLLCWWIIRRQFGPR